MNEKKGLSTLCIHAGEIADAHGSPHTPLYSTTTFAFDSTADLLDVVEGRKPGTLYTRYGLNPTITSLEAKLAALEGAEAALAFGSGMAAEAALFLTHGHEGIICIGDAYGGTLELLEKQLPLLGIPTHLVLASEHERLESLVAQKCGLVFFETPANPALDIIDIRRIAALAHAHGALVAVDNTFASPVNQQPLALGADLVVHSATKYLGGHSDITAGALMGAKRLLEPVWSWRKNLGQMIAPDVASLLARSLRTLVVRVERQNATALAVAQAMQAHPRVARALHPGLPGFPGHAVAKGQMRGFGGMVTLDIAGTRADATTVVDRLRLFKIAPSLGGVESLATQPVTTTHHGLTPQERARRGYDDPAVDRIGGRRRSHRGPHAGFAMNDCVYLDYNATTPVDPTVLEAMLPYLREHYGNPSSSHPPGEQARKAVADARGEVARLLGAQPGEIVFTGCATESNNLAIQGAARARRELGRHVVTTAIEHPSVLAPFQRLREEGFEVTIVPVDGHGRVDPTDVARALRADTVLVSVMHANNETGTIQPVAEIAALTRARGILLHIDAAQSVGKIVVDVQKLGTDLLTLAGHKFYAPKGIGALYVRAGTPVSPIVVGAGQEHGLRPGTENVPAIVALGKAAELARLHTDAAQARLFALRERLHRSLLQEIPGLALNGHPDARLPNTLNVSFPAVDGQALLQALRGKVSASVGAACHSGGQGGSGVLAAMGLPAERMATAVRFSVGLPVTEPDLLRAARAISSEWKGLARRASLRLVD